MRPRLLIAIAVMALTTIALVRHGARGMATLEHRAAVHGDKAEVITVPGGDLTMRDIPKTFQFLEGRFFADAHYEAESHWYPFMNALMAAVVHGSRDGWVHLTYLRCAVLSTLAFWAAALVLLLVLVGPGALLLWPLLLWADWLRPSLSFYPAEGARPALTLLLAVAIWASARQTRQDARRIRLTLVLGAMTGLLGLWHGASFFTAIAVCAALGVVSLARAPAPARTWALPAMLYAAALLLMLAPLLLPQLLHYGTLRTSAAARLWLSAEYRGGNFPLGLRELSLAPRGLDLVLTLVFLDRWLRVPERRLKYAPLGIAWAFSLTLAHLGFVMFDGAHPGLATLLRRSMPAPPHTLHQVSLTCLVFMKALAVWWLSSALARAAWGRWSVRASPTRLVERLGALRAHALPCAGLMAMALFAAFPPRTLHVLADQTDASFAQFARDLSNTVGRGVVYMRRPSAITSLARVQVLYFGADEHANHYVQQEREWAVKAIGYRLEANDPLGADAVLERYRVAYLVEDPRIPGEMVVARCAGATVLEHAGFRLRLRTPCRSV